MAIKKVGSRFVLRAKSTGRKLGDFPTRAAAEAREREIQFFKRKGKK